MNPLEYASKTLILYSLRKNERIDLSCLPDEVFDQVLHGLWESKMCVEGSTFTGKYIKNDSKASVFVEMLRRQIAPQYPRVNRLIAYLDGLKEGDIFRIVSNDAPTMNKQLSVLQIKALADGKNESQVHIDYILRWGKLTTGFRHLAYGYDGIRTVVGEGNKLNRICRFCGRKVPEVTYNSVAHAISEGLGNRLLYCNEECDYCNNKLSKIENNLMHYLDVRRAMGGILSKTDGAVPSVDGKDFVIRSDEVNQPVLYLEKESLSGIDYSRPFWKKLETNEVITHQGIYKSLCKIVIDLIPVSELKHFKETIGWINGSVLDNELPPYFALYDQELVHQPTVDIFLSLKPGTEPYCTSIVHILDVLFVFILPEVDVDKAHFKTVSSISRHVQKFISFRGEDWVLEDASDYTLANPWVCWKIEPGDPQVEIRSKTDPVFMRYRKKDANIDERQFPVFVPDGISCARITNFVFDRHFYDTISIDELHQVSVNYNKLVCALDKASSSAFFSFAFNFSDSSNQESFFDLSFDAEVLIQDFDKYIEIGDYFSIDYHLRDYLCQIVMDAANKMLLQYTKGTDLEYITLNVLIDRRTVRQLYYKILLGDGQTMFVKDATIHNL